MMYCAPDLRATSRFSADMFTGITETTATLISSTPFGTGKKMRFRVRLDEPVKIDQSISHNGACLSVAEIFANDPSGEIEYAVIAVEETLKKTNLDEAIADDSINIERCLVAGQRLDGHFVLGHVDTTGVLESAEDRNGSWNLTFSFDEKFSPLVVPKGSICINGVSLTVVECAPGVLSVTIIPFTWDHTNLSRLQPGKKVNLEFDILGKYILHWQG